MPDAGTKLVEMVANVNTQAFGHALAGACAGAFALLCIYPVDTYKTRRQINDTKFLEIVRREGLWSMYVGVGVGMVSYSMNQFVFYYVYSWIKATYAKIAGKHITSNIKLSLLTGFIAGCVTQVCTLPLNTLHTRLQGHACSSGQRKPPSTLEMMQSIYKENGLAGFWAGLQSALVLSINPSITFLLFEQMKCRLERRLKLSTMHIFFLGAIAKVGATIATFPLVLAKTRLQSITKSDREHGRAYTNLLDFIVQTWKHEGFLGLFKGIRAKCLQVALTAAVSFAAKDIATYYSFALLLAAGVSRKMVVPPKPDWQEVVVPVWVTNKPAQ